MKAIYSAETNEFAGTKPPSGREGDRGLNAVEGARATLVFLHFMYRSISS